MILRMLGVFLFVIVLSYSAFKAHAWLGFLGGFVCGFIVAYVISKLGG